MNPRALTVRPVLHGSKVGGRGGLSALEGLHRPPAEHGDGQAGRAANGLLAGGDDAIQLPPVKVNLFARHAADTVDEDEGVGGDLVDKGREVLELAENTGRGIDVGDGDGLVLLLRQRLFDLGELGLGAGRRPELGHVGAVDPEAVGEAIAKVPGGEHQHILAGLDQVGGHNIPAEGSRARNDEGLRGRVGGLEQLPEHRQGLAKGRDESGPDVALAACARQSPTAGAACDLPFALAHL